MSLEKDFDREIQNFGTDVIEESIQRTQMMGRTISGISGASQTNSSLTASMEALKTRMLRLNPEKISFQGKKRFFETVKPYHEVFSPI